MQTRPHFFYKQSGVIPVRSGELGAEVLLVTTRRHGRWTIPKGVVDLGVTPIDSAVNEAYEEAGVRGDVRRDPIGKYRYHKWGGECVVEVYVLDVREILETWPEARERTRCWMIVSAAMRAVHNEELSAMIASLAGGYSSSSSTC